MKKLVDHYVEKWNFDIAVLVTSLTKPDVDHAFISGKIAQLRKCIKELQEAVIV